jgi:hypothetical protein
MGIIYYRGICEAEVCYIIINAINIHIEVFLMFIEDVLVNEMVCSRAGMFLIG